MSRLEDRIERFRSLSRELRMQQLLNYARKFPELPEELGAARDAGLNRVEECQTPLFMWVSVSDGAVQIYADAPREAPTVRGFMAFLMDALNGQPAGDAADLPMDLLERMGLGEILGVMRTSGLGSVIHRVRLDVRKALEDASTGGAPSEA